MMSNFQRSIHQKQCIECFALWGCCALWDQKSPTLKIHKRTNWPRIRGVNKNMLTGSFVVSLVLAETKTSPIPSSRAPQKGRVPVDRAARVVSLFSPLLLGLMLLLMWWATTHKHTPPDSTLTWIWIQPFAMITNQSVTRTCFYRPTATRTGGGCFTAPRGFRSASAGLKSI